MRQKNTRLPARRATGFFKAPTPEVPLRAAQMRELDRLKERLLQELLEQTAQRPELNLTYRRAANDAVSLAWLTPFPLLFLPALLEEKAAEAYQRRERQQFLLRRTAKRGIEA